MSAGLKPKFRRNEIQDFAMRKWDKKQRQKLLQ